MKQWDMAQDYDDEKRIEFIIGDVREKDMTGRHNKVNIEAS